MQTIGQILAEVMVRYVWARDIVVTQHLDFDGELYGRAGQMRRVKYRLARELMSNMPAGEIEKNEPSE